MTDEAWSVRRRAVRARRGIVAAQHHEAARAGATILEQGGNAVDAAVAAALALAAVEPWMCGLGGSGFLTAWLADEGRAVGLDFQGVLPRGLKPSDYPVDPALPSTSMGFPAVEGLRNTRGYTAITVPGAVAGLSRAAEKWGRLPFGDLVAPALALAETGIPVSWYASLMIAGEMETLRADPASAKVYLPGGVPLAPGAMLRIPGLADSLRRLRNEGAEGFYRGSLAQQMVDDLAQGGSRIRAEDLAGYEVHDVEPLATAHRDAVVYSLGEQSGGLRLRDFLQHAATQMPFPPPKPGPAEWVAYAEALEAAWRAHRIRNGTLAEVGASTSSLSAADAEGNMVAITYTLLDHFGSGVTLPTTGVAMNNGVSYFDPRPGLRTSMEGGKRINSSNMCPTVAVRYGQAVLALGASGGDLIMPCVAQVLALVLDFGLSLEDAMHFPRLDASHRGRVRADPRLGDAVLEELRSRYALEVTPNEVAPKLYACPSAVARDGDELVGIADPWVPDAGAAGPN